MEVLWRLGYLLALLAAGVAARRVGLLTERRTDLVTAVALYVALPALVFSSTYDAALGELVSPVLVAGVPLVIATTAGIAWVVARGRSLRSQRSVAIVQSYHSNLGFLGVPLVALTLGGEATTIANVVLGISLLVHVPLTILTLVSINDAEASVWNELAELAKNPVLVALAAGLVGWAVGLTLPGPVVTGLGVASEFALPLALLGVGASLQVDLAEFDPAATGSVVAMKVGVMPAVAWAVFTLFAASPAALATVVLMFAMPTAVSTYVYASELGGDPRFASTNVFATTVVSLVAVVLVLQVVG